MRAVIYARYSSDQQRAASIDDQVRVCTERAVRDGHTVGQIYSDFAMSGASMLRTGIQALLNDALQSRFDVIYAEALDRISRDQEDIARFYKRMSFDGIGIVTVSEGDIDVLHIGLKGTMNALFIKDLADKTRRGLRGRVEAGRSGGGNAYGFDVVSNAGDTEERGGRAINETESAIVLRIFAAYATGKSPRAIAQDLNKDRIKAPGGNSWGRQLSTATANAVQAFSTMNFTSANSSGTGLSM